jgi:hypothetical protein
MSHDNASREYHTFDPANGYPAANGLYYECLRCGDVVSSRPPDSTHCKCRNIMLDVDYGRLEIEDHSKVQLFSISNLSEGVDPNR